MNTQTMLDSFIETGLWSTFDSEDTGDNAENLDDTYGICDVSESFKKEASEMITQFMIKALPLFTEEELAIGHVAHDLWLTMEGHGAGFWDGDYEKGEELTKLCREFNYNYDSYWSDKLNESIEREGE